MNEPDGDGGGCGHSRGGGGGAPESFDPSSTLSPSAPWPVGATLDPLDPRALLHWQLLSGGSRAAGSGLGPPPGRGQGQGRERGPSSTLERPSLTEGAQHFPPTQGPAIIAGRREMLPNHPSLPQPLLHPQQQLAYFHPPLGRFFQSSSVLQPQFINHTAASQSQHEAVVDGLLPIEGLDCLLAKFMAPSVANSLPAPAAEASQQPLSRSDQDQNFKEAPVPDSDTELSVVQQQLSSGNGSTLVHSSAGPMVTAETADETTTSWLGMLGVVPPTSPSRMDQETVTPMSADFGALDDLSPPKPQEIDHDANSSENTAPAITPSAATESAALSLASKIASAIQATPDQPKKRKASNACVSCQKSHVSCEDERPCARCIKRGVAHLCVDAPRKVPANNTKSGIEKLVVIPSSGSLRTGGLVVTDAVQQELGSSSEGIKSGSRSSQSSGASVNQRRPIPDCPTTIFTGFRNHGKRLSGLLPGSNTRSTLPPHPQYFKSPLNASPSQSLQASAEGGSNGSIRFSNLSSPVGLPYSADNTPGRTQVFETTLRQETQSLSLNSSDTFFDDIARVFKAPKGVGAEQQINGVERKLWPDKFAAGPPSVRNYSRDNQEWGRELTPSQNDGWKGVQSSSTNSRGFPDPYNADGNEKPWWWGAYNPLSHGVTAETREERNRLSQQYPDGANTRKRIRTPNERAMVCSRESLSSDAGIPHQDQVGQRVVKTGEFKHWQFDEAASIGLLEDYAANTFSIENRRLLMEMLSFHDFTSRKTNLKSLLLESKLSSIVAGERAAYHRVHCLSTRSHSSQYPDSMPKTAVWRRTGEVLSGSASLAEVLGLPWEALNPSRKGYHCKCSYGGRDAGHFQNERFSGTHGVAHQSRPQGNGQSATGVSECDCAIESRSCMEEPRAVTVYELMTEDSATAYWSLFLAAAFPQSTSSAIPLSHASHAQSPQPHQRGASDSSNDRRCDTIMRRCVLRIPWWGWGSAADVPTNPTRFSRQTSCPTCGIPCSYADDGPGSGYDTDAALFDRIDDEDEDFGVNPDGSWRDRGRHENGAVARGAPAAGRRRRRGGERMECVLSFTVMRSEVDGDPLCVRGTFHFV